MKYCDTDLARQALSNLIIQSGDKPDPKALFLCYKLGLLEGNDIFGELVYFVLNTKETDHLVEYVCSYCFPFERLRSHGLCII